MADLQIKMRNGDWRSTEPRRLPFYVDQWQTFYSTEDGFEPAQPLRAKEIARLGDVCDEAEKLPTWCMCRDEAILEYYLAIRDKIWFEIAKLQRIKKVPTQAEGLRLRDARAEAWDAFETIKDTGSLRDVINARGALALAEARFEIGQRKFHERQRYYRTRPKYIEFRGMKIARHPTESPRHGKA